MFQFWTNGTNISNVVTSLPQAPGIPGAQGNTGNTGNTGPKGDTGSPGTNGTDGAGITGTPYQVAYYGLNGVGTGTSSFTYNPNGIGLTIGQSLVVGTSSPITDVVLLRLKLPPPATIWALNGNNLVTLPLIPNTVNTTRLYSSVWPGDFMPNNPIWANPIGITVPGYCTYDHNNGIGGGGSYTNSNAYPLFVQNGTASGELGFTINFVNYGLSTYSLTYM